MAKTCRIDKILWNDFWQTAKEAKVYALACSQYCSKMRKRKDYADYVLIGVPAVGSILFEVSPFVTLGSAIFSSVGTTVEKFFNIYTQKETELYDLYNYALQYNLILSELETEVEYFTSDKNIPNEQFIALISQKKKEMSELGDKVDKLMRKAPDCNEEAENYLRSKYENL